ncbi:hypothetical protein M3Y96_01011300 [Aphelenchoides besseyi]|nr:hypothetical protein M3Y96_01011300 [Aphelenchoides besseyi]
MKLLFLIVLLLVAINGITAETSYEPQATKEGSYDAVYIRSSSTHASREFFIEWPGNVELTIKFCGGYTNSDDVRWKFKIGECVVECRAQDPFHTDQWEIIFGDYNSQLFCPSSLIVLNDHRLFEFARRTEIGCQGKKLLYYFGLIENIRRTEIRVYDVVGIDYVDVYLYAELGDVKLTQNHMKNDYQIACPAS